MNAKVKHFGRFLLTLGIDPRRLVANIRSWPYYLNDKKEFDRQRKEAGDSFGPVQPFPILNERFEESGTVRSHYFRQDLLVAQRVFELAPTRHIDVGSRLDGFIGSLASFRKVEVLDIRPMPIQLKNIEFHRADLMNELPAHLIECTDSLSCLHTIEHFGLGRYGDPVCYDGHLKGWRNLSRILAPGGTFHFSTPIGRQRIEFNAHRVFSIPYLMEMFSPEFEVIHFSYLDDKGNLHENADIMSLESKIAWGCLYGCGIFELRKKM